MTLCFFSDLLLGFSLCLWRVYEIHTLFGLSVFMKTSAYVQGGLRAELALISA